MGFEPGSSNHKPLIKSLRPLLQNLKDKSQYNYPLINNNTNTYFAFNVKSLNKPYKNQRFWKKNSIASGDDRIWWWTLWCFNPSVKITTTSKLITLKKKTEAFKINNKISYLMFSCLYNFFHFNPFKMHTKKNGGSNDFNSVYMRLINL